MLKFQFLRLSHRSCFSARVPLHSGGENGRESLLAPDNLACRKTPVFLSLRASVSCFQSWFSSVPHFGQEMGKKKTTTRSTGEIGEDLHPSPNEEHTLESTDEEKSLYEILGVERAASQQEIKKAYYKLALCLHPDKNPGDEEAKERFQLLQKVISVLGDEEKRAVYDQTGCVDDADLAGEVLQNLQEYFRSLYKKVTEADIEEFEANYTGSDAEVKDLKGLYIKFKGNMDKLFCSMICSEPKLDSHRFKNIINEAIATGELKSTKAYEKWAKLVSETPQPIDPLKQRGKLKQRSDTDLLELITQCRSERKEQFKLMFLALEKRHGGGGAIAEPTEEEFEAARNRLEQKNKQTKKKKGK